MKTTTKTTQTRHGAGSPAPGDGLGEPAGVDHGGWRDRIRSKPGLAQAWRIGVFLLGLLFVALGLALSVLPGPLTIPPVLAGLWVWSTEFEWAKRFFDAFNAKAQEAWRHAKLHPVSSGIITVGGLALAGIAFWTVNHYQLIDQAKSAMGL